MGITLKRVDDMIRKTVKEVLHLSEHTPNDFLYAPLREGGLGVFCLFKRIPGIILERLGNLEYSQSAIERAVFQTTMNLRGRMRRVLREWPADGKRSGAK